MATLSVVIAQTYNPHKGYKDPVPAATAIAAEAITTSGSSQVSNITTAGENFGMFWVLTVTGGNVWVKFGTNPTAAAGDQWLLLDGQTRDFSADPSQNVQKLAVINA